jgi:drug/metabolite transporter (DMT)-like permease
LKNATYLLILTTVVSGISTIVRKAIMGRVTPIQYETVSGCMHAAFALTAFLLSKSSMQNIDLESWALMMLQSLLSIIAIFSFMYALKDASNLGAASAIVSAAPMVTLVLTALFYKEWPDIKMLFGILLILLGTAIVTLK